ncbi:PAS domain S-box protein [Bacillus sp. BRMEA1]|uniref:two-component system sensor histidine kinase NtrB n=1 Tax=Neobacillus endophyticus TaxID=2738405 RepID=UPI001563E0BF|nr:ATP-binding protein [Neobacillus endophyticus]NRD77126.1 PAS domain S-box protein [Neobacillus endophyticus]
MTLHIDSKKIDFHQLVENSLNSIWIVNLEGEILYCNRASLSLLKLPSTNEIISKCYWRFLLPDFHEESKERLKKVLENKEIFRVEVQMVCGDGEIIDVEVITNPFYLENQIFAQVTMQNITQRKLAEKLLNDNGKLVAVGQIAAGIAHEVKNPLTSVKGFLQLLKEVNSHPYIDIMDTELTNALNTIKDLLQVAKPDLHHEPAVPIDFCKELDSIISLFQDRFYDVEIELDLKESVTAFIGKRNLFQKAFFNLIKNALEAMDNKGKIRIEHFVKDEWIHIKISDTGMGIPEEKLQLLGTPFFSSKVDGTGLGLTQVYTTVHEHHGIIVVQSEVGKGTTFHIQLPSSS